MSAGRPRPEGSIRHGRNPAAALGRSHRIPREYSRRAAWRQSLTKRQLTRELLDCDLDRGESDEGLKRGGAEFPNPWRGGDCGRTMRRFSRRPQRRGNKTRSSLDVRRRRRSHAAREPSRLLAKPTPALIRLPQESSQAEAVAIHRARRGPIPILGRRPINDEHATASVIDQRMNFAPLHFLALRHTRSDRHDRPFFRRLQGLTVDDSRPRRSLHAP